MSFISKVVPASSCEMEKRGPLKSRCRAPPPALAGAALVGEPPAALFSCLLHHDQQKALALAVWQHALTALTRPASNALRKIRKSRAQTHRGAYGCR